MSNARMVKWVVAGAALVVTAAAMAAMWGDRADAGIPGQEIVAGFQVLAERDPLSADEVDFFTTYDLVRDVVRTRDPVKIPMPWVKDLTGFDVPDGAQLYVDDEHQSIVLTGRAAEGSPILGQQVVDVMVTADWDETDADDTTPVINLAVKANDVELQDFSDLLGDGVTLHLRSGWIVFTNTSQTSLDLSQFPRDVVDAFYEPIADDELLPGGRPFALEPGANFMADLALDQMPSLDRALSLAGVNTIDLRIDGTLSVDAGVLFGEATADDLAALDLRAALDVTGPNPPAWLTDRTFSMQVTTDDQLNPIVAIGDTVTTLVGEASNTFKHGFEFDPAAFDEIGPVPIEARFDLLGDFVAPFGVDVPGLLSDATGLDIGLEVSGVVDLTTDDFITEADVTIEVTDAGAVGGPATLRMELHYDEVLDALNVVFDLSTGATAQALADELMTTLGGEPLDLGALGPLGLDHVRFEIGSLLGTTRIAASASLLAYPDVLGFEWLDLDDLTVTMELSDDGISEPTFDAVVAATVTLDGTTWQAELQLEASEDALDTRLSLRLGDGETIELQGLVDLLGNEWPAGFDIGSTLEGLHLHDIVVTVRAGSTQVSVDVLAGVAVPDLFDATLYFNVTAVDGETPTFFVGLRPTAPIKLGSVLAAPGLENVDLPNLALIATSDTFAGTNAADLTPEAYEFLKGVHGCEPSANQPKTPPLPQPPDVCTFLLRLQPGLNLVANIQLPDELSDLSDALWLDIDKGVQFVGTITPPLEGLTGAAGNGGMRLLMELPAVDPPDTVDFLESGRLSVELKATFENPSIQLKVIGELDTRFRRSAEPATSCTYGELMTGFDVVDDTITSDTYCYDRLKFEVSAALAISGSSLQLTLEGALVANSPEGWEAPFGLEWITMRELRGQLGVAIGADGFPTFKFGVRGDVIVADKQLTGSLSMGLKVTPAPPPTGTAVVPQFFGIRGYVSSLGSTDLVRLWSAATGGAEFPVDGMPLFEVRNAEFMVALEKNESLCLEPGIGVAGELFIVDSVSPSAPAAEPSTAPGTCAPFGAKVDPDTCFAEGSTGRRDDGCFASFFGMIEPNGIRVDGAIGPIDLGPVHFQDARLRMMLTQAEQSFLVRGGVTVDGLGTGELEVSLAPTSVGVYGNLEVFETFQATVRASAEVGLEAPFTPTFDAEFEGLLRADFDAAVEQAVQDALQPLLTTLRDVRDKWDGLAATQPSDFTQAVRDLLALVDEDATGLTFLSDVDASLADFGAEADALEADIQALVDDFLYLHVEGPTLREVVDGGSGYVEYGMPVICGLGEVFDPVDGRCETDQGVEKGPGIVVCLPGFEALIVQVDGQYRGVCRLTILVPDLPLIEYEGMLAEIGDRAAEGLGEAFTGLETFATSLTLDALIAQLEAFEAPGVFALECAAFSFDTADGGPTVAALLKARVLEETYGFDLALNLGSLDVAQLVDELMQQFLTDPDTITCPTALEPPPGISAASFIEAELTVHDASIVEGETAMVAGAVLGDVGGAAVTIDWGDGSADPIVVTATGAFEASHVYVDDPAGPQPSYQIQLLIDGQARATAPITVANARPVASAVATPTVIDEGGRVTLAVSATDAGTADSHRVTVSWGDGTIETLPLPAAGVQLTHAFVDDDPSGTPSDAHRIMVLVRDDDAGTDAEPVDVIVRNVAPTLADGLAATIAALNPVEGSPVGFTVAWDDPGLDDTFRVDVAWGDGSTSTHVVASGTGSVDVGHTYADDDPTGSPQDAYAVTVTVTDDDTGAAGLVAQPTVANVAPVITAATLSAGEIDERQSVTVRGSFTDAGIDDTHTVVVDWGNPRLPQTVVVPTDGSFLATRTYGDDSGDVPFSITVTVIDDDTGQAVATSQLAVSNRAPRASINTTGSRPIGGADTFIVGIGDEVPLRTMAIDVGSDDLTLRWDFDTLTPGIDVEYSSLVPGQTGPDPLPSPDVNARLGSAALFDVRTATFAAACRQDVELSVTDDDAGSVTDSVVVIVVGDATRRRSPGYWTQQYEGKGGALLPAEERFCAVRIVDHLSSAFGEVRQLLGGTQDDTFASALAILDGKRARTDLERFDRQLLAAWLNVASGSIGYDEPVDTDGDLVADTPLSAWLTVLESGRATASAAELTTWTEALDQLNR